MIYPINTTKWKPGDVVVHTDDAKSSRMLMEIIAVSEAGVYSSVYLDARTRASYRNIVWTNALALLLDPSHFDIEVPPR